MSQPGRTEVVWSDTFWFKDGDIVLQAETKHFRVHSSVLSLHSDVMRDMFTVPQPNTGKYLVDGCVAVNMPDSAKDIENLCKIIYGMYEFGSPTLIDASLLGTMIRLGRKYEIARILKTAISQLHYLFPKDLEIFELRRHVVKELFMNNKSSLFDIVNLSYECDIPSIRPVAFLHMANIFSVSEIMNGEATTQAFQREKYGNLGLQARLDCLMGRMLIIPAFHHLLLSNLDSGVRDAVVPQDANRWPTASLYAIPTNHCTDRALCSTRFSNMLGGMVAATEMERVVPFPSDPNSDPFIRGGLCGQCALILTEEYTFVRATVWLKLPEYFNLPNWNDITDFDHNEHA